MENEKNNVVDCCHRNSGGWIYYDDTQGLFKLIGYDDPNNREVGSHPIEYCPWCGILLDTNLLEE